VEKGVAEELDEKVDRNMKKFAVAAKVAAPTAVDRAVAVIPARQAYYEAVDKLSQLTEDMLNQAGDTAEHYLSLYASYSEVIHSTLHQMSIKASDAIVKSNKTLATNETGEWLASW
jgi:hypothetical protein